MHMTLPVIRPLACLILLGLGSCGDPEPARKSGLGGIDVSHFQGVIDWPAVKSAEVRFTYIKVSQGTSETDPMLGPNWRGAVAADLHHGGYHVFDPGLSGLDQAQYFLNALKSVGADYNGALPPALDIETLTGDNVATLHGEITAWLDTVGRALSCKPILYTDPNTWNSDDPGNFSSYGLWLADYSLNPDPPDGWATWRFWQYTDKGQVAGINGPVDLDRFAGDSIDLDLQSCIATLNGTSTHTFAPPGQGQHRPYPGLD